MKPAFDDGCSALRRALTLIGLFGLAHTSPAQQKIIRETVLDEANEEAIYFTVFKKALAFHERVILPGTLTLPQKPVVRWNEYLDAVNALAPDEISSQN